MKMRDAHRFAKLAMSLLEQEDSSREIAGEILMLIELVEGFLLTCTNS
jgi:hypothetical protein